MKTLWADLNKKMLTILFLGVGFAFGWYGHQSYTYRNGDTYTKLTTIARENSVRYTFTNPLLFIDNANVVFHDLDPLKNKIQSYISIASEVNNVQEASVYFRDLTSTRWTGVGEDNLYDPASMNKVILLIAYLKKAENDPSILSKTLYYSGNTDQDSFYQTKHELKKGNYYSVQELLVDMIVKSGNDSTTVLFDNINKNELAKIYLDLDIPLPQDGKEELISTKIYSRLFRVLYSSTYLTKDLSEQVLNLLNQTEFDKGLKVLLPNIPVAHKFGERTIAFSGNKQEHQLHDCGIVYYPKHPYFLCVMTKGDDFSKLQDVIASISYITYEYWDALYKN